MELNPIDNIIALLKNPAEDWSFDTHTATHNRTQVEVWTSNGILFADLYPVPIGLGLLQKWRLWQAVKIARRNYWAKRLSGS